MLQPTVYIFINKSLNMSVGKVAAQAAHAMAKVSMLASKEHWLSGVPQTVLIMEGKDGAQLKNIAGYLSGLSIENYLVVDEGTNEIEPYTVTALATQVVDKSLPNVQAVFKGFKTYRDTVRVRLEIDK